MRRLPLESSEIAREFHEEEGSGAGLAGGRCGSASIRCRGIVPGSERFSDLHGDVRHVDSQPRVEKRLPIQGEDAGSLQPVRRLPTWYVPLLSTGCQRPPVQPGGVGAVAPSRAGSPSGCDSRTGAHTTGRQRHRRARRQAKKRHADAVSTSSAEIVSTQMNRTRCGASKQSRVGFFDGPKSIPFLATQRAEAAHLGPSLVSRLDCRSVVSSTTSWSRSWRPRPDGPGRLGRRPASFPGPTRNRCPRRPRR